MSVNIQSRMVQFPVEGGTTASAYEARPAGSGACPAILVIQEWWGLNEHIKDIARRLAEEDFIGLAPDLYGGKVTTNPGEASSLMQALDREAAVRILLGAIRFLQENEAVCGQHIGVMGFCMGGSYALLLPCRTPAIKAAVPFYGDAPDPVDQMNNIRCPVLFFAGAKDQWINAAKVQKIKDAFQQFGIEGEVRVYPEADHAFFNDTRHDVYNPAAAQDAWTRALGLFSRTLKC